MISAFHSEKRVGGLSAKEIKKCTHGLIIHKSVQDRLVRFFVSVFALNLTMFLISTANDLKDKPVITASF